MDRQKETREEFAEAFERDATEEPAQSRIYEELVRSRMRIEQVHLEMSVLRRRMWVGNTLTFVIAIGLIALVGLRARSGDGIVRLFNDATGQLNGTTSESDVASNGLPEGSPQDASKAATSAAQFEVDRQFTEKIHNLYRRARSFHRHFDATQSGDVGARTVANEEYLQFMVDLSNISEQAATENASTETRMAIVNIATVAQDIRKTSGEVGLETQQLMRQIEAAIYPDGQPKDRRF